MKLPGRKTLPLVIVITQLFSIPLCAVPSAPGSTNSSTTASDQVSNNEGEVPRVTPHTLNDAATQLVLSTKKSTDHQKAASVMHRQIDPATPPAQLAANPQTAGAQQVTFKNKTQLPSAAVLSGKGTTIGFSFTQQKPNHFKPPGLGPASNAYATFINAVEATSGVCPIFRRFHITALQQIYEYLLGVYTTLNLTSINDAETYTSTEKLYSLNKKTLIMGYLIDIIESQFNQALNALFPQMGRNVASYGGMIALQADQASKLDLLITDIEQIVYQTFQIKGIFPDEWACALSQLSDATYARLLTTIPAAPLESAKKKIHTFVTVSMDVGMQDEYGQVIRDIYGQPPQTDYFKTVPSGAAWQEKVNELTKSSVDPSTLPAYVSLMGQLTLDEITALFNALNAIIPLYAAVQKEEDLDALIGIMKGTSKTPATASQESLLLLFIQTLASSQTVPLEIARIQRLYPKLQNPKNTTPFTPADIAAIKMVTSYVCLKMEQGTTDAINSSVLNVESLISKASHQLTPAQKTLFDQLRGSTALQRRNLQLLAEMLSAKEDSAEQLTDPDRQDLSDGFKALAKDGKSFPDQQTRDSFTQLATEVNKTTFSVETLSDQLQQAYITALDTWVVFDAPEYTADQSQADLRAMFPEKDKSGEYIVDKVTAGLNAADESYFDKRTPAELLMILASFQGSGQVVESRLREHQKDSGALGAIFTDQASLNEALYNTVDATQYMNLIGIHEMLNTSIAAKKPCSCADLGDTKRAILVQMLNLLVSSPGFTPAPIPATAGPATPPKPATGNEKEATEKPQAYGKASGYLDQILDIHTRNPTMPNLPSLVNEENINPIIDLYTLMDRFTFKITDLSASQKELLAQLLQTYRSSLPSPDEMMKTVSTKGVNSSQYLPADEDGMAINMLAPLLSAYINMIGMQKSFIKVIGDYLNFSNTYTAPLLQERGSILSDSVSQSTLPGAFEQSVQSVLQANPNNAQINPPLFFYDNNTIRTIKMIASLAQLADGSQSAPYPTYAIQAALSTDPTSSDPAKNNQVKSPDGKVITLPSLTVNGNGFSPQFFFKDQYGNPFSNTGDLTFKGASNSKLPWLTKQTIGSSSLYTPAHDAKGNQILPKGQEGLYMNLYMTISNKMNPNAPLLRFYEQPLIGQPDWLNSRTGIMTMLRMCLGDFASALSLDAHIFEPVINLAIAEALASLPQLPANLRLKNHDALSIKQLASLKEQSNLQVIKEFVDAQTHQQAAQAIGSK